MADFATSCTSVTLQNPLSPLYMHPSECHGGKRLQMGKEAQVETWDGHQETVIMDLEDGCLVVVVVAAAAAAVGCPVEEMIGDRVHD